MLFVIALTDFNDIWEYEFLIGNVNLISILIVNQFHNQLQFCFHMVRIFVD